MNGDNTSSDASGRDTPYIVIVGILAAMIVVCLATLWLMERNRRVKAQRRLAEVSAQRNRPLEQLLGASYARSGDSFAPAGAVRPLQAADIVHMETADDTRRLKVSAEAGRRLGFRAGDVIQVVEATTSRPGEPPADTPDR
ncbi:MAG: hypothetical protein KGY99_01470 [Phycisphaerae bacterium]|nr:hypothetical protein [Phycisphaerae bacterium]